MNLSLNHQSASRRSRLITLIALLVVITALLLSLTVTLSDSTAMPECGPANDGEVMGLGGGAMECRHLVGHGWHWIPI